MLRFLGNVLAACVLAAAIFIPFWLVACFVHLEWFAPWSSPIGRLGLGSCLIFGAFATVKDPCFK